MPIFQNAVIQKYLNELPDSEIKPAWEKFTTYFHNATIQENIRNLKEEQYQGAFIEELFVKILGYIKNPNPNFNITTELKNERGAKKADGAILNKESNAIAVIELKGTDTKDLDKVSDQAFSYKNHHRQCEYVITSNFEKLRFYIDNAVEFIEFKLFELTFEDFKLLWICLQADNLLHKLPSKIKEQSLVSNEKVTKALYKDYSNFKTELWQNLVKNHPNKDPLTLFKKAQKLLDRLLFIFFAEDKGLLPPNSISKVVDQWEKLKELDEYRPLYERFVKYFGYLDTGWKGKEYEIFAYNGGLFYPDPLIEELTIDDEVLLKHVMKLTTYDFDSEVDVNILGHIFEHSLNEIENITAELEGKEVDKSKTKRKKDGVFYTPKYITKYIVENTVGKLCEEKKAELGVEDEEYAKGRKNRNKDTLKRLTSNLKEYRNWLLDITICDPACGSGAFLNQALEFLIAEHRYLDELEAQLLGGNIIFQDVRNHILERNIFGVDLNEESVEIAKLSLWLRTAERGRKLTSLNNNIKSGNSLIDDPAVAGDKAFNWKEEFPQVFDKGGFNVIIGNPPYVRQELLEKKDKEYFVKKYKTGNGTADLYVYFYEIAVNYLKENGKFGYITPNKFYKTKYGKELRQFLINYKIVELIDFFELKVFEDASTDSQIFILEKTLKPTTFNYSPIKTILDFKNNVYSSLKINPKNLSDNIWVFNNAEDLKILNKMKYNSISLEKYTRNGMYRGITTGLNEAFIIDEKTKNNIINEDPTSAELIKPYINATDIDRYFLKKPTQLFFINTYYDLDISKYKGVYNWLLNFDEKLKKRQDKGVHHFNLRACKYYDKFEAPKIIYIHTAVNHKFYYDEEGYYINNSCYLISNADKFLSAWLNSKIFKFYKKLNFVAYGDSAGSGRAKLDYNKMVNVPIPQISVIQKQPFIDKTNQMLQLNKDLQEASNKFIRTLQRKFEGLEKLSTKLENWYELSFNEFIKELKKKKIKLTLSEEAEWEDYFLVEQQKALALKQQIDATDKEIDQMVYQLYGLTEEEIKIVEGFE